MKNICRYCKYWSGDRRKRWNPCDSYDFEDYMYEWVEKTRNNFGCIFFEVINEKI